MLCNSIAAAVSHVVERIRVVRQPAVSGREDDVVLMQHVHLHDEEQVLPELDKRERGTPAERRLLQRCADLWEDAAACGRASGQCTSSSTEDYPAHVRWQTAHRMPSWVSFMKFSGVSCFSAVNTL